MECDKRSYPSAKDAANDIIGLRQRYGKHKYSLYKCAFCGNYHITTVTKKILKPNRKEKYPLEIPIKAEHKQKIKKKRK